MSSRVEPGPENQAAAVTDEQLDALFDLDRVSTRYRHDVIRREERNVEVAEANRVAREALEDPEMLIRLTRGKDLLASTRKFVQDTYGVSFGNHALVSELHEGEVDSELWEVLEPLKELAGVQ